MPTPPSLSHTLRAETFRRSRDDTMLLGVCAGVGRALGIAPVWIRLGALALVAILPALGLLSYALLGVIVRREDERLALGGNPPDSRETVIGWGLVALAAYGALTAGDGLVLPWSGPLLLLACAAAAAVGAQTARRKASQGQADGTPPLLQLEASTEATTAEMPADDAPVGAAPAATEPAAPAPGPSLLAIGVALLALLGAIGVLVAPAGVPSAGAPALIAWGAGVLGILALAGVVTAIALAGRRHAGGLLALSLVVGVLAVGMASVHDQAGSQPALQWLLERAANLFFVDR